MTIQSRRVRVFMMRRRPPRPPSGKEPERGGTVVPLPEQAQDLEGLLRLLQAQRAALREALDGVQEQLRVVGTALCPGCAATGLRRGRGGFYGEIQLRACDCPYGQRRQPDGWGPDASRPAPPEEGG
jgi:hypothetical protein